MAIPEYHKQYLDILNRASENGDLALMEAKERATGEIVTLICAVSQMDGEVTFTPLAQLPKTDNPFDAYLPPDPDGGFVETELVG